MAYHLRKKLLGSKRIDLYEVISIVTPHTPDLRSGLDIFKKIII
jgi:hypothetical protein